MDLEAKLKNAALKGDAKKLAKYVEEGADVNHSDSSTALINAVQSSNLDCIKYLVGTCNADVNQVNSKGETPLHYASYLGSVEIVQYLLLKNASLNVYCKSKTLPIHYAILSSIPELAVKLLDLGSKHGREGLLDLAVPLLSKHDKPVVLRELIKRGTSIHSFKDPRGNTLVHIAILYKREKCVEMLLEEHESLFEVRNGDGHTPLMVAAMSGNVKIMDRLLSEPNIADTQVVTSDAQGRTAAHYAASAANPANLAALVLAGANVESEDAVGLSPLTFACSCGSPDVVNFILKRSSEQNLERFSTKALIAAVHSQRQAILSELCENATIMQTGFNRDESPIHLAGFYGSVEIIETLLSKKPELLHAEDDAGRTILHVCALKGKKQALQLLCQKLSPEALNKVSRSSRNALWYAAHEGFADCVQILLNNGVEPNKADDEGLFPLAAACKLGHFDTVRKLAVSSKVNLNVKDTTGKTPMVHAVIAGQLEIVRFLIQLKAKVNTPDRTGMSPLHHAAKAGRSDLCVLLVKSGNADLAKKDKQNKTPLHAAVYYGRMLVALELVALGAKVDAVDIENNTCAAAAQSIGHHDLARLLSRHI